MLLIPLTIWLSLSLYTVAALILLRRGSAELFRLAWSASWLVYVVHVAVAFHFFHHWSHAHAVEHVRSSSGVGEGLYVSYLFSLLWSLDVAWAWLAPSSHGRRPAWIGVAIQTFMLFMVVNATIVFEKGVSRWLGVAIVELLARQGLFRLAQSPTTDQRLAAGTGPADGGPST